MIKVSAPGKIHISGEHSVVYGKPALLCTINKRVYVTIQEHTSSEHGQLGKQTILLRNTEFSMQSDKNVTHLPNLAIKEAYAFLNKTPRTNIALQIHSELPIGCGMGSSAAVSAAIVGAIFCL